MASSAASRTQKKRPAEAGLFTIDEFDVRKRYFAAGAEEAELDFFLWCFLACVVDFASEDGAEEPAGASAATAMTGPANIIRARAGTSLLTTSRLH
jgi:hypothetical protein